MAQRMNPHHAITAPLGMMRYEEDGQYVSYSDYASGLLFEEDLVRDHARLGHAFGPVRRCQHALSVVASCASGDVLKRAGCPLSDQRKRFLPLRVGIGGEEDKVGIASRRHR